MVGGVLWLQSQGGSRSQGREKNISGMRRLQQERNLGDKQIFTQDFKEFCTEMCRVIFPSPRTFQHNLQDLTILQGVVFSLGVEWFRGGAGWERL